MSLNDNNFKCINNLSCEDKIGYNKLNSNNIAFIIISSLGIILNIISIIQFFIKKSEENKTKQAMKTMFYFLSIFDLLISIYWFISSVNFYNSLKIYSNYKFCGTISFFYIMIFSFEFIYINFILYHFRLINFDPIQGLLNPDKKIKLYIIISFILSLLITILCLIFKAIGKSPLMTCFITINNDTRFISLIFIIPIIISIAYFPVQIIIDFLKKEVFIIEPIIKNIYEEYCLYIIIFYILHLPLFICLYINLINPDYVLENESMKNFTFISLLITMLIPFLLVVLRIIKIVKNSNILKRVTYRSDKKKNCLEDSCKSSKISTNSNKNQENNNLNTKLIDDPFDWMKANLLNYFLRDIFIGISTCIKKSIESYKNLTMVEIEGDKDDCIIHNINLENNIIDVENVKKSGYLKIKVYEYGPKSFSFLRKLDNIDLEKMLNSFLPKNNTKEIENSQGKSGQFFISTGDNKYILKTLKENEFDLIKNSFLNKYVKYLYTNKKSLLCRIYGMYDIIINNKTQILLIVMRNVIGDFKDNVIAKYDLKGSTLNRKNIFRASKIQNQTLKDLNFNEIENKIFLSNESVKKLIDILKEDSLFLSDSNLMDYSLFVVTLTINKKDEVDIFGPKINNKLEHAYSKILEETGLTICNEKDLSESLSTNSNCFSAIGYGNLYDIDNYRNYLFPSLNHGKCYIISIIDYLQYFNFYKFCEQEYKTKLQNNKKLTVSCVDPKTYSIRFIKYILNLTQIKDVIVETEIENKKENIEEEIELANRKFTTNSINSEKNDEKNSD